MGPSLLRLLAATVLATAAASQPALAMRDGAPGRAGAHAAFSKTASGVDRDFCDLRAPVDASQLAEPRRESGCIYGRSAKDITKDPNGYQDSVNQYAYGANDPINHRDPTGRASVDGKYCEWFPAIGNDVTTCSSLYASKGMSAVGRLWEEYVAPTRPGQAVEAAVESVDDAVEVQRDALGNRLVQGAQAVRGSRPANEFPASEEYIKKKGVEAVEGGVQAAGAVAGPLVGGGAKLSNLTTGERRRIQNAANRIGKPISLVGGRAAKAGGRSVNADWDYVIEGINAKKRNSVSGSLPGAKSVRDGTRNLVDWQPGPVNPEVPHITFLPEE